MGLAAVFAGMTVLLVVLAAVLQDIVVLFVALPFAASTYIFWQQATGRLHLRFRPRQARDRARTQQTRERGGFGAGPRDDWIPPGDRRRRAGGRDRRARERYRPRTTAEPTDAEAYRTLDLEVGADEAAVRAAYRERVKEVHPDRPGGDKEAFKRVTDAYERLVGE